MNENVQKEENMNQITKETFEFLWFSYFGITVETAKKVKEKNSDMLIKICAQRAYLDMCRTLQFIKEKNISKEKKKERDELRDKFRNAICEIIADNITDLFSSSGQESFNGKHKKICNAIIKKAEEYINEGLFKDFTYGQAQKWLNMTIKYMYLMGFWKGKFEKIEKVLHVPVDSYIIQAVWKTNVFLPLKNEKVNRQSAYSDEKVKSWSQWNNTMYENFQTSLKTYIGNKTPYEPPLKWETRVWLEKASEKVNKKA